MCGTRVYLYALSMVAFLVTEPSLSGRDDDSLHVALGEVYVIDAQTPSQSVTALLHTTSLNGSSSWVQSSPVKVASVVPLSTTRFAICLNGCWRWHESTVELLGTEGTIREIRGTNELPDILNRPLTGSLSNRSQEVRIVQMRQQISQAIADCRDQQRVFVCVKIQTLVDPQFRVKGYSSIEQMKSDTYACAKKLNLTPSEPEGPDKEGTYRIRLKGEVISHATFQRLRDTEPRLGTERIFYLAEKAPASISIASGTSRFVIQHSSK